MVLREAAIGSLLCFKVSSTTHLIVSEQLHFDSQKVSEIGSAPTYPGQQIILTTEPVMLLDKWGGESYKHSASYAAGMIVWKMPVWEGNNKVGRFGCRC
jgi:hypothetical protein